MKLSDYRKRFKSAEWADFALAVGTTVGHLNNVLYERRVASAALARQIAAETGGMVPVWETRPEDWRLIWPELVGPDGAPKAPAEKQEAGHAA